MGNGTRKTLRSIVTQKRDIFAGAAPTVDITRPPVMTRKTHITLDDIARRLKVSRVTVSKALRGHPDISDRTIAKVKSIAAELGYTPNILARNLSARRSQALGLVVPKIAHSFFGSVIEEVYNTAFENNQEIILMVSQEDPVRERKHIETLIAMRVDGILISVSQQTKDLTPFLGVRNTGIPLIFVDRVPEPCPPDFSTVTVDDHGGAYQAVAHAAKVGYKRIAHLAGFQHVNIGKRRQQGFQDAMRDHHLIVKPEWMIVGGFGTEDGYRGMMNLIKTPQRPELIFAVTFPVALGVYEAARELGMNIPDDIDIICFGDSAMHRHIHPPLSCVYQPTAELGRKAVSMLLDHIKHPDEQSGQHVRIPTELILRGTCLGKNKGKKS